MKWFDRLWGRKIKDPKPSTESPKTKELRTKLAVRQYRERVLVSEVRRIEKQLRKNQ